VAKYLHLEIYKDITEICIYYNDKSNRYVNCAWDIEHEYVNSYQKNEIETLKNGRELIHITITANEDSKN